MRYPGYPQARRLTATYLSSSGLGFLAPGSLPAPGKRRVIGACLRALNGPLCRLRNILLLLPLLEHSLSRHGIGGCGRHFAGDLRNHGVNVHLLGGLMIYWTGREEE